MKLTRRESFGKFRLMLLHAALLRHKNALLRSICINFYNFLCKSVDIGIHRKIKCFYWKHKFDVVWNEKNMFSVMWNNPDTYNRAYGQRFFFRVDFLNLNFVQNFSAYEIFHPINFMFMHNLFELNCRTTNLIDLVIKLLHF